METVRQDTGLQCLALLLRFHQLSVDPAQIAHQFSGGPIGVTEMIRCAKSLKLKVRAIREDWAGLAKLPLPAIVELNDGSFVIAGKVTADDILVQVPAETRPRMLKRGEFERDWSGRVVLMARRDTDPRKRLMHWKAATERNPRNPDYWQSLADSYLALGEWERAQARLEHAAVTAIDASAVRQRLAELYRRHAEWERLADLLVAEAERAPDDRSRVALLREAAGLHAKERSDPARAVPLLRDHRLHSLQPAAVTAKKMCIRWTRVFISCRAQVV